MSDFQDDHCIDAPVAPVLHAELIKDRRRPDRIHDVSPALIPLLRNPAGVAVVNDIVPVPGAIMAALQGIRLVFGSFGEGIWASLGVGISTAITVWFATGHGSWIAVAAANMLWFLYGIGLLM
jgi:hypothetical protein